MKWRRLLTWTIGVIVVVTLAALGGGYLFLKSARFQQLAIGKIVKDVHDATGAEAKIAGLDVQLSTLTAHLHDVELYKNAGSPLLRIDKLTAGFNIRSALHHSVRLSELVIEHPVMNVHIDQNGNSNLPTPLAKTSSGSTNVFDLAVSHLQITDGTIFYDDQATPVQADIQDLAAESRFDWLRSRYDASISYKSGSIRYGQYAPFAHAFRTQFSATPAAVSIESAVLEVGASSAEFHGQIANYGNPIVTGTYNVRVGTQDLRSFAPSVAAEGDVMLDGEVHYQNGSGRPVLRSIVLDGELQSPSIVLASRDGRIGLHRLRGRYRLSDSALELIGIEADTLGGAVKATGGIEQLDSRAAAKIAASLRGISLSQLERSLKSANVRGVSLRSTVDGTVNVAWNGPLENLTAQSDLRLKATASGASSPGEKVVPVSGVLRTQYSGARNVLTVSPSTLEIPSTSLAAQGELGGRSQLQVKTTTSDLHELSALISSFLSDGSQIPDIGGSATSNFTVTGSLAKPVIEGKLSAQNLEVRGGKWKTVDVSLQASSSRLTINSANLTSATQGTAALSGTVGLQNWSYQSAGVIDAHFKIQQFRVSDLEQIAKVQYPVRGDLSANVSLRGSQLDPSGSGFAELRNAEVYGEPLQTLKSQFHAANGVISSTLEVAAPAGAAHAALDYTPRSRAYAVRMDAPSLLLEKLHTLQARQTDLSGRISVSASGTGTLDNPQLRASVEAPELTLRQRTISGVKADVNIDNHFAHVSLDSRVVDANVRARGQVQLSGDYNVDASFDTGTVPLEVLLASFMTSVPEGFHGQSEYHATIKGPLKKRALLTAHLSVPVFNGSYQGLTIAAAHPIEADYSQDVLTVLPAELRGTGTDLQLQGSLPFAGSANPSLTAKGSLDVRVLRIFDPSLRTSGAVVLDVRATRGSSGPSIQGQARLQNIALATDSAPIGLEKLNGTIDIADNRLHASDVTAQVGGGPVSVRGSVVYRPSLQFDVTLQGTSVRLLYPEGIRSTLDCNLSFAGSSDASHLSGRVLVDGLSFTPDFDLASFGDQFDAETASVAQPGFADRVQMAVAVQSKENLSASSSQVSIEGSINLQVIGTAANPVVIGRTDLTSGEIFYRNVRYQLQQGLITFDDPNETRPKLNVSASTTVEQYNLTLNLRGSLDKLNTSYTSDPPLATADIINLIARGKTTEESAAASTSTDSMIASQAASQVSSSVQKFAGISSLQIDPLLGGNNSNPSARIALQQRVTRNLLFSFSTDVSQPGGEIVEGDYQINQRWSVSVARDQSGGVAVDGRLHTKF